MQAYIMGRQSSEFGVQSSEKTELRTLLLWTGISKPKCLSKSQKTSELRTLNSELCRGFSIVELSIVLVIIGLLVAGAMAGKTLLRTAELRSVISEIENFKVQVDNFSTQYEGLPGDLKNAQDFFGNGTDNGDNNGHIGTIGASGSELFDAWQQLILGRFLVGDLSGDGTDAQIDVNVPRSKYVQTAGYSLVWDDTPGGWKDALGRYFPGNVVIFGSDTTTNNSVEGAALNVEDAYSIDAKIDNDQPDYGKVLATNGDGVTGCTTDVSPNPAEYNFGTEGVVCKLYFHLQ